MLKKIGLVLFCVLSTLLCQGQKDSVYQKRIINDKKRIRKVIINYPDSVRNMVNEIRKSYSQIDPIDEVWLIYAEGISKLYLADYKGAQVLFEKAVIDYEDVAQRIKNSDEGLSRRYYKAVKEKANTYNNLGIVFYEISDLSNAISNYQQAVEILQELIKCPYEKIRNAAIIDLASSNDNIGGVYSMFGEKEKALTYELAAEKLLDEVGSRKALQVKLNIANVYKDMGQYDSALSYTIAAHTALDSVSEAYEYYNSCSILGDLYIASGQYDKAKSLLTNAVAYFETNSPSVHLIVAHFRLFECFLAQKNFVQAKITLDKGMELAIGKSNVKKEADGYHNYHRYYTEKALMTGSVEDFKLSIAYVNKHHDLQDSLFSLDRYREFGELQTKYETEKKDLTIKSLEQQKEVASAQIKIYLLVAAFVFLVMISMYLYQRLRTKRNLDLLEKEKEVDRLKSDFFANISHEFRTPLTLILGPIESLLSDLNSEKQREQLGFMKTNAMRLLNLINQILDLSKIEAGQLDRSHSKFELISLVKGVIGSFQSLIEPKGIDLELTVPEQEILINYNTNHLETICINLISNAYKFCETGGTIKVSLEILEEQNQTVLQFIVTDDGVGISPEHLKHIFDRFYQVKNTTGKSLIGTGIGLALTNELVKLNGGTINISSQPKVGTSVSVRLPLEKEFIESKRINKEKKSDTVAVLDKSESGTAEEEKNSSTHRELKNDKSLILLIEDNDDVRTYIKAVLTGYATMEAENGEVGIQKAKESIPDLIISDVMMPLMDGYEVAQELKQDERTSHIPLILLTGKSSVDSRIQGLETEADLYLSKPFVPQELLLCIQNLIESRRKLRLRYNKEVVLRPSDVAVTSIDEQFLQKLMSVVEKNYQNEEFSVDQLCAEVGMSRSQLHRKLNALTNESTTQFIRSFRLQRAMVLLKKNHAAISEIAFKVGFSSHSYFNKSFQKHFGCTPSSVKEVEHN